MKSKMHISKYAVFIAIVLEVIVYFGKYYRQHLVFQGDSIQIIKHDNEVKRRWFERQEYLASRYWDASLSNQTAPGYLTDWTVQEPVIASACSTLQGLNWPGSCTSVSHRQKVAVNVSIDPHGWLAQELNTGRYDCAVSQCSVSVGNPTTGDYDTSHIFLGLKDGIRKGNQSKAPHPQIHATLQMESLANQGSQRLSPTTTDGTDWLVSHRQDEFPHDQWLPISYINSDAESFRRVKGADFAQRRDPIPLFVSACQSHTDRNAVMTELAQNGLVLESFGKCSPTGTIAVKKGGIGSRYPQCATQPRRSAMWDAQKECVMYYTKVTLVLENTFEEHYLTEKLWQPLKMGAVPVLHGDPSLYRHLLPSPDAAVFLQDFPTLKEAVTYIHQVLQDETLWKKHTAWKQQPFSNAFVDLTRNSFASLACNLCDKYASSKSTNPSHPVLEEPSIDIVKPCAVPILNRGTASLPVQVPVPLNVMDPFFGIEAVYVTHYTPLKSRKAAMIERVREHFHVDPIFVTEFDREVLSEEDLTCLSDRDAQIKHIQRVTKKGEDSLTLKHLAVYYHMVQHSLQNVLVLEDDASFRQKDWQSENSMWQTILRDLPPDYDMVFLSGCCGIHWQGTKFSEFLSLANLSRVSSAYLLSNKGARNMLRSLIPITAQIDFAINIAAGKENEGWIRDPRVVNLKIFHTEPFMSHQKPRGKTRTVMDP